MKPPRFHRSDQTCGGCCIPLHVTDPATSVSQGVKGKLDAKFEPADACAQGQDIEEIGSGFGSAGRFGT